MDRRATIKLLAAGGLVTASGSGYHWLVRERHHPELALGSVLERLGALEPDTIETNGAWGAARTLDHLAQSVEFSMDGFPVARSKLFRDTAGRLAFAVFQARGRMTHGVEEAIPGEVVATDDRGTAAAHRRLVAALERFESHDGPLMPHFAYGELDKTRYALAHAMHVHDHVAALAVA